MMRNLKARLQKLEAKKPPVKRVVRIYWADGTFVGEMRYQQMNLWGTSLGFRKVRKVYLWN